MKFTLSWLKDYLDTTATLDEICEGLIGVGLEVEEVSDKTSCSPTSRWRMYAGREAPECRQAAAVRGRDEGRHEAGGVRRAQCAHRHQGDRRTPGVTIPATRCGVRARHDPRRRIQAMLCSERELLISDEHNGIIEVEGDWPVGTPAAKALGLDDPMIYVKVTPNRPDALGIYGIARDLAAKGLGTLKPLDAKTVAGTFDSPIKVSLDFADGDTSPARCSSAAISGA